jgi:hypothetical protein
VEKDHKHLINADEKDSENGYACGSLDRGDGYVRGSNSL